MFEVKKCKTKAAYSTKLTQQGQLDLSRIKSKFPTTFESPILLVINVDGYEIVVHKYGELLFKNGTDENKIRRIAEQVYHESILRPGKENVRV